MNSIKTLDKKYWIIIVVAVVFVFGLNQYRSSLPSQPEPLSTRGLPPPATDVPVTLPPDPGEAGKVTLEGIDSNSDGVRDDLEREIVYMYPQNEEVRRVLRADMKIMQQIITTMGDHEYLVGLFQKHLHLGDCYANLTLDATKMEIKDYVKAGTYWDNLFLNTQKRKDEYQKQYYKATPFGNTIVQCKDIQGQY